LISKCVCIVCLITCDCHGAAVQIWAHDLKQCNIGYLKKFLFLVTVAILDLGLDMYTNFKRNQTITVNFGLRGSEKIFYVKC